MVQRNVNENEPGNDQRVNSIIHEDVQCVTVTSRCEDSFTGVFIRTSLMVMVRRNLLSPEGASISTNAQVEHYADVIEWYPN